MENKMPENNPYREFKSNKLHEAEQDFESTQLYDDGTGRGAMIAKVVATGNPLTAKTLKDDYLESLFSGENLSEEFKLKATTIFEAAINEKVSLIESAIIEASKEIIEEQAAEKHNQLVEHVDGYLNYVINEWMEDNKVAIERGIRTEIAENFMNGLKQLFETSFIDVPNEKYNVLEDLYAANEELQENANTLIKENMQLKQELTLRLCAEAFIEESAGLADTQVEKLAKLAEGIDFSNVDQYRQKIALLKESYFGTNAKTVQPQSSYQSPNAQVLTEDGSFVGGTSEENPVMESIVNAISSINRHRPAKPMFKPMNDSPVDSRIQQIMNPSRMVSPKDNLF